LEIALKDEDAKVIRVPAEIGETVQTSMPKLEKVFLQFPVFALKTRVGIDHGPAVRELCFHDPVLIPVGGGVGDNLAIAVASVFAQPVDRAFNWVRVICEPAERQA